MYVSNNNLKNTPIYITHIKPCMDCESKIKQELKQENTIGCNLVFPEQGNTYILK